MKFLPCNLFAKLLPSGGQPAPRGDIDGFLAGLSRVAERVENLHYRFGEAQNPDGFVQLWRVTDHWIQIHRLWTLKPNRGDGTRIIRTLCVLADQHDIGIRLKVLPIGRKPFPLARLELKQWYERHGFVGKRWNVQRLPLVQSASATTRGSDNPKPLQ